MDMSLWKGAAVSACMTHSQPWQRSWNKRRMVAHTGSPRQLPRHGSMLS